MRKQPILAVALGAILASQPITQAGAAVYAEPPVARSQARLVERIQANREWHRGPGPARISGLARRSGMARSRALAWSSGLDWPALLVRTPMGGAPVLRHDHRWCRTRYAHHCRCSRVRPSSAGSQPVLVLGRSLWKPRVLGLLRLEPPGTPPKARGVLLYFARVPSRPPKHLPDLDAVIRPYEGVAIHDGNVLCGRLVR